MTKNLLLSLLLLIGCTATPEPFDRVDWAMQGVWTSLHAADWLQTRNDIAVNPDYHETNPILGKNPNQAEVDLYFGLTYAAGTAAIYYTEKKYRPFWHVTLIMIQSIAVMQNHNNGVSIKFEF